MVARAGGRGGSPARGNENLWRLFWPLFVTSLSQQLYQLVAVAIAGHMGGTGVLAAVQAVTPPAQLFPIVASSVATGMAVPVGEAYGAGDARAVSRLSSVLVKTSVALGVLLAVAGAALSGAVVSAMGVDASVSGQSAAYLAAVAVSSILMLPLNGMLAAMRACGRPGEATRVTLVGLVANAAMDAVALGVLDGGALGLGISQALAYALMLAMAARAMTGGATGRGRREHGDGSGDATADAVTAMTVGDVIGQPFDWRVAARMLAIGLPLGGQAVCFTASAAMVQAAVNGYGLVASAAYGVSNRLGNLPWSAASALGLSATVAVSQDCGAGDAKGAEDDTRRLCRMSFLLLAVPSLVMCLASYPLCLALSGDAAVASVASRIYWVSESLYVVFGLASVWLGAVKGTGDGTVPLAVNVAGVVVVRVAWIALLAPMAGGIEGAVLAMPVSWVAIMAMAWVAWRRKVRGLEEELRERAAAGGESKR